MYLKIHPETPEKRKVDQAVKIIEKGGIVIYPTDSVYSMGCDLMNKRAIEKLAKLKGLKLKKAQFSIICNDLSELSDYTKGFPRATFKLLNKNLPGPFTFILQANNKLPKLFDTNRKTIGIRIPDNTILQRITDQLGRPLVTTSIHDEDEILEYSTDPELIKERYEKMVDLIIDGGMGNLKPSTVVDCSTEVPEIIREGIGELKF